MSFSWLSKLWIAVRFVCFGISGLLLFFVAAFAVALPNEIGINRSLAMLLFVVGLLMLLYGVGLWGQWGYALVFLSFPLGAVIFSAIPIFDDKSSPALGGGIVAFITYYFVRQMYQKRNPPPEEHEQ